MNKLYPIKSIALRHGKSKEGETYNQARMTLDLGGSLGVITVSLKNPGVLPGSWSIPDGVTPVVNKTDYRRFDRNLGRFVPSASEAQADQVEKLIGLGYAGVEEEQVKALFAVSRREVSKNGTNIIHLRRVAEGKLNIVKFPVFEEEDGVAVVEK